MACFGAQPVMCRMSCALHERMQDRSNGQWHEAMLQVIQWSVCIIKAPTKPLQISTNIQLMLLATATQLDVTH